MIKMVFKRDTDGRRLVMFGITEDNVKALKDRRPLQIRGEDVSLPGIDIAIMYGESMRAIIEQVRAAGVEFPTADMPPAGSA